MQSESLRIKTAVHHQKVAAFYYEDSQECIVCGPFTEKWKNYLTKQAEKHYRLARIVMEIE